MTDENKEIEVLHVDVEEEQNPSGENVNEEEVIPPMEEEEPQKAQEENKEISNLEQEPLEQKKEPKPVDGETPREKALRLEITRLRTERRNAGNVDLLPKQRQEKNEEIDKRIEKLKEKYSLEELQNMEEAIDVLAAKRGYVRKEQAYQQAVDDVIESFLDIHPEYKPENDADDERWTSFKTILKRDYNIEGKTPRQIYALFEKANRDVREQFGENFTEAKSIEQDDGKIQAQRQKIQSVSHAGGGTGKSQPSGKQLKVDPTVRSFFKGFEDEDFIQ